MNFDTGSEDGDGPDPLLNSIMDAMSSMKEATADKIYQRIHKQGNTNYSKPQVDRALANALKYGIFEVRNNRYRIKEEPLDDEDTVYCRKPKNREQTPYRCDDYFRGELNPEKDNRRFKAPLILDEKKCHTCGKIKKPVELCDRPIDKSPGTSKLKNLKSGRDLKINKKKFRNEETRKRKSTSNSDLNEEGKKRKQSDVGKSLAKRVCDQKNKKKVKKNVNRVKREVSPDPIAKYFPRGGFKDSDTSLITHYTLNAIECCAMEDEEHPTTSNVKVFTLGDEKASESDFSDTSAVTEESRKYESKDEKKDDKTNKKEEPEKESDSKEPKNIPVEKLGKKSLGQKEKLPEPNRCRANSIEVKSEWHPEEIHEGTSIRQTNNALTVEPMDALPFKNPEGATYFS